jgi:hypothetical protein
MITRSAMRSVLQRVPGLVRKRSTGSRQHRLDGPAEALRLGFAARTSLLRGLGSFDSRMAYLRDLANQPELERVIGSRPRRSSDACQAPVYWTLESRRVSHYRPRVRHKPPPEGLRTSRWTPARVPNQLERPLWVACRVVERRSSWLPPPP